MQISENIKRARIKEGLARRIVNGEFSFGERFPGLHDLSREYSVSYVTVSKAVKLLESEGYLRCQNGVDELASLGRDFRAKFSSILSPYNPNSVVFTSTFVCFPPVNTFIVSDGFCFPFFHFVFNLLLFFETNSPLPIPIHIIIPQSTNRKHEQVKVQLHLGMR